MQQHERPSGRRPAPAHPSRRPRLRLALATAAAVALTGTLLSATAGPATAADGTHAPRADFNGDGRADVLAGSYENDGNGAVLYLPSNGTKITATGSRTVSPSASGVSTTGYPNFGANFAD
ncbi:hypothetical protein CEB94_21820 [Streptomyces hawaiiensis]|uniref:Integrin-like protein n=1 Tax=Streptomyces hawaiiensis TaxID=67305 RepID=A0A6G5RHY3_9ACTN|nr:hypothetical protein CEB94_21820 [Streptomyces hawaiiensis]